MKDSLPILSDLRRRGVLVRRTLSGKIEVSSDSPITEALRQEIRAHRTEIHQELDQEVLEAIARADAKAQETLGKAKPTIPRAIATETTEGTVFMSCKRRDGSGWVISIPAEAYDPWKLSAEILASASPEEATEKWRKRK